MDWNEEIQGEFADVIKQFSLKYAEKVIEDFNTLCQNPPEIIDRSFLQKLKAVEYNGKLKPFINLGIDEFNTAYDALEENKLEKINYYRKKYFESKIADYKKQAEELSKQTISPDRKKSLESEFDNLRDEFLDFLELQMSSAKDVTVMLSELKTFNFSAQQRKNLKRR